MLSVSCSEPLGAENEEIFDYFCDGNENNKFDGVNVEEGGGRWRNVDEGGGTWMNVDERGGRWMKVEERGSQCKCLFREFLKLPF